MQDRVLHDEATVILRACVDSSPHCHPQINTQRRCKSKISILESLPFPCNSLYASAGLLPARVDRPGGRKPWCDGSGSAGSRFLSSGCCRFSAITTLRSPARRGCMRYDSCSDFAPEEDDSRANFPASMFVDGRRREDDWDLLPKTWGNSLFMRGLQPGRQPHTIPTPLSTDIMMKVVAPYPV
jgi:hypothetical protein